MVELIAVSLAAGFAITVVLPFLKTQVERIPGVSVVTGNPIVKMIVVGFIAMIAINFFVRLAKKIT